LCWQTVALLVFCVSVRQEDRANIDDDELADFKKLVQPYDRMTDPELGAALSQGDLLELRDEE